METVIRIVLIYLAILIGLRVLGKREFSQLSPFELVTLLMIPELVQQAAVREDFSITNGMIALSTLFSLVFLTSVVTHLSKRAEQVVESKPSVLVYNGEFVPENLNRERVTPSEVFGEMHKSGLERLEQVRWALLESDGRISFIPAEPADKQIKRREELVE